MTHFQANGRYNAPGAPQTADGWTFERLTPISHLFGANGMRAGPDGRLYVAQCVGSQVSAIDVNSGAVEVISAMGGDIVGPDDLAFDDEGGFYATEVMNARVCYRDAKGNTRVLRDDLPSANGITVHQGRLFIDECRPGGRLLELDLNGGAPRVIADNLMMPNALSPGPDGMLYYPQVATDEIWRIDPAGGAPERVVADLHHPVAVKFDASGYIVSPQSGNGEILRIDPRTGAHTVLASVLPGLDNLAFVGERLFVSHMTTGSVTEILAGGATRSLLSGGFQFPLDQTIGDDGALYFTDTTTLYRLQPGEAPQVLGRMFAPGFPGTLRGIASAGGGAFAVATTDGRIVLYRPSAQEFDLLADGLDQPYAVAVATDGAVIVAEKGGGRIVSIKDGGVEELARGLAGPTGVTVAQDGTVLASESDGGRVVKIVGGRAETVLDGLGRPEGLTVSNGVLYVVDTAAKTLIAHDLSTGARRTIASGLPVGAPAGVTPKPLLGFPPFSGPLGNFAGLASGADGALYLSADAEGSVVAIRPA